MVHSDKTVVVLLHKQTLPSLEFWQLMLLKNLAPSLIPSALSQIVHILLWATLALHHMSTISSPFSNWLIMSNFSLILIVFCWFFAWITLGDLDLCLSIMLISTQPLKMSTRDFSWGKGSRCVRLMTYHPHSAGHSRKSGALSYPEPLGSPWPVAGWPLTLLMLVRKASFLDEETKWPVWLCNQCNQSMPMTAGMTLTSLSASFPQKISAVIDCPCLITLNWKWLHKFEKGWHFVVDCCITLGSAAAVVYQCCVYCKKSPSEMEFFIYVIIVIAYIFNICHVVIVVYKGGGCFYFENVQHCK